MILNSRIFLLGMSGHAMSVMESLRSNNIQANGYFDKQNHGSQWLPYLGDENSNEVNEILFKDDILFPAVGDNKLRFRLTEWIKTQEKQQIIIQHSSAIVSKTSQIGLSSLIAAGTIVNANAQIGVGTIINSGAIIEHECIIDDFVHVGPGTVLTGNVKIGKFSFIGANATIKQSVSIGKNVIIGAGSVVLSDVPDNCVYVGNPAKYLRNNE
jgi:sugar O-acyltransferase (sialic acid O-acetyltransferase NeuD family)